MQNSLPLVLLLVNFSYAQNPNAKEDDVLKDQIYNKKKSVLNYSMKDFDALFLNSLIKK
jgi:hypothetical protein